MNPAPNLALIGPTGAGKTTIGRRIAALMGLEFVDADREIESRTGASIAEVFACEGEAGFRARERDVLGELLTGERRVIASGGGAVLDPANRARLRERAFVVWLQTDVDEQLRRLSRDRTRPLLQRADREDVLHKMATDRAPLYADIADLQFVTGQMHPDQASAALLRLLEDAWQCGEAASS